MLVPLSGGWGKQKLAGTQVLDRMWLKKIIPQYYQYCGNKVLNPRIWDYVYQFHAPWRFAGNVGVQRQQILTWSRPCCQPGHCREEADSDGSLESWQRIGRLIRREIFNSCFERSLNRWDRWYIITQLAVYTTYRPLIYCQFCYYMLPIPPIKGTRKLRWRFPFIVLQK